jgi:hypothetical protein
MSYNTYEPEAIVTSFYKCNKLQCNFDKTIKAIEQSSELRALRIYNPTKQFFKYASTIKKQQGKT